MALETLETTDVCWSDATICTQMADLVGSLESQQPWYLMVSSTKACQCYQCSLLSSCERAQVVRVWCPHLVRIELRPNVCHLHSHFIRFCWDQAPFCCLNTMQAVTFNMVIGWPQISTKRFNRYVLVAENTGQRQGSGDVGSNMSQHHPWNKGDDLGMFHSRLAVFEQNISNQKKTSNSAPILKK